MNQDDLLESIAEDFLAAVRSGKQPPPISYYVNKCPDLESEIRSVLDSLRKLEAFSEKETHRRQKPRAINTAAPESLGEFEIVREIGRGGMGTVYLAADRVLDRRVALKVLELPDSDGSANGDPGEEAPNHRAVRFQREARLASRLHHTNIVPVFGVGQEAQHLYYAMQFIDGVDLRKILRALTQEKMPLDLSASLVDQARRLIAFDLDEDAYADSANDTQLLSSDTQSSTFELSSSKPSPVIPEPSVEPAETAPESNGNLEVRVGPFSTPATASIRLRSGRHREYFASVASIGIQVCDALQYAHSCGVIHRDIKPSNLIMDRAGAVWVTDFGLAKLDDDQDLTRSGDVLGTLRYMAPEQLDGGDEPRSDVYALGLTLYELLSLQPAHQGTSLKSLLEQKKLGKQPALSDVDPSIPRDLETIVLKSIHPEPARRYPTAQHMQDDLQNFLHDRPITARRASILEKGFRWCRRNQSLAALIALIAALPITLPIVLGVAYRREALQREKAEERFHIALDGLDQIYSSFVHPDSISTTYVDSSDEPAMRLSPEAGPFLEKMLVFYDRLAADDPQLSPVLLRESARAFRRVGDMYQALGQFDEALDAYSDAKSRYTQLANPDTTIRILLAEIDLEQGRIYRSSGSENQAQGLFATALNRLESDNSTEARLLTAQAYLLRGQHRGRPPADDNPQFDMALLRVLAIEDLSDLDEEIQTIVAAAAPPRPPHGPPRNRDVSSRSRPADQSQTPGGQTDKRRAEKKRDLQKAIEILDAILEDNPTAVQPRYLRAIGLRELGRPGTFLDDSQSKNSQAAQALEQLVQEFPNNDNFRFELSQTYRFVDLHRPDPKLLATSLEQLHLARRLSEELVASQDQIALYRINLAHIYASLGILYDRDHRRNEAEQYSRMAMSAHRYVAANFPGLEAKSRGLLAGPTFALTKLLLEEGRVLEVLVVLNDLEQSLIAQIEDVSTETNAREKARLELKFCNFIQRRTEQRFRLAAESQAD